MTQYGYASDTDAILILIQIQLSDTVQIRSRQDAILILIQTQTSDTVQIRSRHGYHSDTYSDSIFYYNSDTLQTRTSF